jgi:preprotein translocase subunit SecF
MELPNPYESKHYKKMILIPLVLIVISLVFIRDIPKGVDLKGGSLITVMTDEPSGKLAESKAAIEAALSKISSDVAVRQFENPSGRGFEIEVGASDTLDKAESKLADLRRQDSGLTFEMLTLQDLEGTETDKSKIDAQRGKVEGLKSALLSSTNSMLKSIGSAKTVSDYLIALQVAEDEYQLASSANRERIISEIKGLVAVKSYTSKEVGASLSRFFLSKTAEIILVSLLAAALLVIAIFRGTIASVAVMFGAFADIVITAGMMGLLGIPLSLATVAALMMLIGFSVDTDMLLTIRALKRTEGEAKERVYDAMQTAFVMNSCAIAAFAVLVVVATLLKIETYYQIGMVALIGGLIDFIATWAGNAVMVLWYAEIRKAHGT